MFNLTGASDKIQVVTSTTGNVDLHASWVDLSGTTPSTQLATPNRKNASVSTAVTTDMVPSPAGAVVQSNLKCLTVRNRHASTSNTVTVKHTDGTNVSEIVKVTLLAGYLLIITDTALPVVFDQNMAIVTSVIAVDPKQNDFRLTGVSVTPVMTADSTSLSTIYMTQFKGNRIALSDGTNWQLVMPSSETSLAVTGRTTDLPFDIFCYINAGVATLEFLDWTSATARATGLTRVDGVWTKTGDQTRRWMGSCRARSATTFHWVLVGTDAPCKMDLFNADNRVDFNFTLKTATDTWTYTTATWRQAQGSANYQVDIMVGIQEEQWHGWLSVVSSNSTASIARSVCINFDATNAIGGLTAPTYNSVISINAHQIARFTNQPTIGRHFYAWLEWSTASGTCTFRGDDGAVIANVIQSGMTGQWTC